MRQDALVRDLRTPQYTARNGNTAHALKFEEIDLKPLSH